MKGLTIIAIFFCLSSVNFAQEKTKSDLIKEVQVGTNFASLYRKPFNGELIKTPKGFITDNQYLNVEFIFKFNPRFSLRIPLAYGLGNLDGKVIEGGDLKSHFFNTGPDSLAPSNYYIYGPKIDAFSISHYIQCNNRCSESFRSHIRPHYLKYQVGIFPKVSIHNWEKVNLSFSLGANFGFMDKYAISEYSSFSSNKNSDDTIVSWTQTNQRIEYETNTFFFVRGESLLGIDVKLTKRFSLNYETGFSTIVKGQGKKPDKIYTNLDGNGYKLVLSDNDNTEYGHYSNDEYDSFSTKWKGFYNQFYWVNRFSLRYQIR
jgi:hypothetical protein